MTESSDPLGEEKAQAAFRQALTNLRDRLNTASERVASQPTDPTELSSLAQLGVELDGLSRAYLDQLSVFAEERRKIEETERKKAMAEKRAAPRDDAQIQKLSEELSTGLRLERVDAAIKELLDFLGDAEFFAANASVGRKRKLRTLQNGIEKALAK